MKLTIFPRSSVARAFLLTLLPHVWCSASTYTAQSLCETVMGVTRVNSIKTESVVTAVTATAPVTVSTTITPSTTTTKTVAATFYITTYTQIIDVTTTLKNTIIDTFTSTTTLAEPTTVTNTVTITTSATTTDTITGSASTLTIPTSPGFTPASSAGGLKKREASPAPRHDILAARRPVFKEHKLQPRALYPDEVLCIEFLEVVTTTTKSFTAATTTITSTTGGQIFHESTTVTSTVILTSLAVPASTTSVVTTSMYITTTVPATTTTTIESTVSTTVIPPASMYYAACGPDNLLYADPYDGGTLNFAYGNDNVIYTSSDTAYDCCVACVMTAQCGGGVFQDGSCQLDIPNGCDPTYAAVELAGDEYSGPPSTPVVAFDGNCGQVQGT